MRVPKIFKKAIYNEADILFTYPVKKDNDEITLRSIQVTLENGNEEYLVTNLMPEQLAESHFKVLYKDLTIVIRIGDASEEVSFGIFIKPLKRLLH